MPYARRTTMRRGKRSPISSYRKVGRVPRLSSYDSAEVRLAQ